MTLIEARFDSLQHRLKAQATPQRTVCGHAKSSLPRPLSGYLRFLLTNNPHHPLSGETNGII